MIKKLSKVDLEFCKNFYFIGLYAIGKNNEFGTVDGNLPWSTLEERKNFLNIISDQIIIVGAKTFINFQKSICNKNKIIYKDSVDYYNFENEFFKRWKCKKIYILTDQNNKELIFWKKTNLKLIKVEGEKISFEKDNKFKLFNSKKEVITDLKQINKIYFGNKIFVIGGLETLNSLQEIFCAVFRSTIKEKIKTTNNIYFDQKQLSNFTNYYNFDYENYKLEVLVCADNFNIDLKRYAKIANVSISPKDTLLLKSEIFHHFARSLINHIHPNFLEIDNSKFIQKNLNLKDNKRNIKKSPYADILQKNNQDKEGNIIFNSNEKI